MLSISSALLAFFSEKGPANVLVDVCRVNAHVDPHLRSCWFNDVYICSVKGSYAARGRFAIFLGLTRDEHFSFDLGRQSRLAGHLGDVIAHQIVSSCVEAFVAKSCVSSKVVEYGVAGFAPLGGAPAFESSPWPGIPRDAAAFENWVEQCGLPPAWQGVEPVSVTVVCGRPGRVVPWKVAEPSVSETSGEVLSSEPESVDGRRIAGLGELPDEVTKTHPLGRVVQIACQCGRFRVTKASEAGKELGSLFLQWVVPVACGARCPWHGGECCSSGNHCQAGEVGEIESPRPRSHWSAEVDG